MMANAELLSVTDDERAPEGAPMPSLPDMAAMLREFEARLAALPDTIDSSWLDRIFDAKGQTAWQREPQPLRRAEQLRRALQLQSVPLEAFAVKANRLALLEREMLWKVLAARALFARRDALRKCIDRSVVQPLRSLAGSAVLDSLRTTINGCTAGADRQLRLPTICPSPVAWALSGYASLESAGIWSNASLQTMIKISLPALAPPDMPPPALNEAATEDQEFMQILPTLFPELTWLFG